MTREEKDTELLTLIKESRSILGELTRATERSNEIKKAADEHAKGLPIRFDKISYIMGAKWADENPKSPWISVKDDLPCNNHNFIHFGFTNRVLVRNKNGDLFVAYMKKNKDNEWIWCNDTDDKFDLLSDITYWMPIPKLSK